MNEHWKRSIEVAPQKTMFAVVKDNGTAKEERYLQIYGTKLKSTNTTANTGNQDV